MAWYGVNFVLGTGLHSYGFGVGGESYVMTAVGLDLIYVGAATTRYLRARPSTQRAANLAPDLAPPTTA
jgi:hypothetical protein